VFAINHATGYAGLSEVPVPPLNELGADRPMSRGLRDVG